MCGVHGRISKGPWSEKQAVKFHEGLSHLSYRGPDSNGHCLLYAHGLEVELLHQRLAILDLSEEGHQPMSSSDGRFTLIYNGEVYNYKELRTELTDLGYSFRSDSDTEVILAAWANWGEGAVAKFNGMFAFAVFDSASNSTWLVRDRFGVKPLHWALIDGVHFLFSSSGKALFKLTGGRLSNEYLLRGLQTKAFEQGDDLTVYEEVRSVPPGTVLRVDNDLSITQKKWYDLEGAVAEQKSLRGFLPLADQLEFGLSLLRDAVALRLRSDVPVAVSLSGGLDSSTILAHAAEQVGSISAISYGSLTDGMSEGPIAQEVAHHVGADLAFVWPEEDKNFLRDMLDRTMTAQESPWSGLSVLAQNEVFRLSKSLGATVMLGGQGGDEVFAGYRKYFFFRLAESLNKRDPTGTAGALYSLARVILAEYRQWGLYANAARRYIPGQLIDKPKSLLSAESFSGSHFETSKTVRDRQVLDVSTLSLPTLLRYEDRNSMFHSIETRLPFVDFRVVEFGLSLPAELKTADGYGKFLLRHVMRHALPPSVTRPRWKRGFDVTQNWISSGLGDEITTRILDNFSRVAHHTVDRRQFEKRISTEKLQASKQTLDEALLLLWIANS